MKRIVSVLCAIVLLCGAALAQSEDLAAAPLAVIESLYRGDYEQVFDQSTADVQTDLGSGETFAAMWTQLEQTFGAFEEILSASAQEQDGLTVGTIVSSYALADVSFSVALTADGLLAGLTVNGFVPKAADSTADRSQFVTEPIKLRAGEADETQGILTLPLGDGPFPAVLMMQGSGSTDMNETAFGISPFRDIAEGLALAGVASIRYDKYSFAHADLLKADPALLAAFTIKEEYTNDARAALALLETDRRIGSVYLLGHSLGGMVTPRVMQALGAEHFAGGIILEGSPLPLWEIQYHQNLALIPKLEESNREASKILVDNEAAKSDQIQALSDEELKSTLFFGISAYYQKDQMSVDAAQTAIALGKPLLITQGGKDWQVSPADGIEAWRAALQDKVNATYLEYHNMNHMLCDMEGEPAGDSSDYAAGSFVSQTLIGDLAAWIRGE